MLLNDWTPEGFSSSWLSHQPCSVTCQSTLLTDWLTVDLVCGRMRSVWDRATPMTSPSWRSWRPSSEDTHTLSRQFASCQKTLSDTKKNLWEWMNISAVIGSWFCIQLTTPLRFPAVTSWPMPKPGRWWLAMSSDCSTMLEMSTTTSTVSECVCVLVFLFLCGLTSKPPLYWGHFYLRGHLAGPHKLYY